MKIRFLVTGGTFDKEYNELNGALFFKDTHVREMLRLGRCNLDLELRTLMMIDSTEMTDVDREHDPQELRRVEHASASSSPTAPTRWPRPRASSASACKDKTIVLTGAMVPYTFGSSDGLFNLGSALAFAQTLPHGRLRRDERPLLQLGQRAQEPLDGVVRGSEGRSRPGLDDCVKALNGRIHITCILPPDIGRTQRIDLGGVKVDRCASRILQEHIDRLHQVLAVRALPHGVEGRIVDQAVEVRHFHIGIVTRRPGESAGVECPHHDRIGAPLGQGAQSGIPLSSCTIGSVRQAHEKDGMRRKMKPDEKRDQQRPTARMRRLRLEKRRPGVAEPDRRRMRDTAARTNWRTISRRIRRGPRGPPHRAG